MASVDMLKSIDAWVQERTRDLFEDHRLRIYKQTDRIFLWLMIFQWIGGIVIALVVSPKTWIGAASQTHVHVWAAIFLGGLISALPIALVITIPGHVITRYTVAVSQMLFSALLIHLTGGRIETHFHVFGSLAFLAFYRDWRILVPATIIVALDHFLRGVFWPQSVFGVLTASPWRWVEHAAWVGFEDIFLISACCRSVQEMWNIAERTAQLEANNQIVEVKVRERTRQLLESKEILSNEIAERQKLEMMIVQAEKMAAVGQLAAGVAHEINNPVGFISNNLEVLERYIQDYTQLLRLSEELKTSIIRGDMGKAEALAQDIDHFKEEMQMEHVMADVDTLLKHNQRGIERIRKIIMDLRTFAREDTGAMDLVKIEEVIDSILSIVHNEIKYKAELKKEYGNTPMVRCSTQRLGQVFINLLVNAVQAIDEKGAITIRTYRQGGYVHVEVSDTGKGIQEEHLKKIFDPFFTTKPVGQGTGLGLSVSYEIVKKHGVDMRVHSVAGHGATFTVVLPVDPKAAREGSDG